MPRISKVTTSEEAAKVLNEKRYHGHALWGYSSAAGVIGYDQIIKVSQACLIANELSGYFDQLESDRAALLEASQDVLNNLTAYCPDCQIMVYGKHKKGCAVETLAAVIARVKGEGE